MEDIEEMANTINRFYDGGRESGTMMAPIEGFCDQPLVTIEEATEPLSIVPDIQNKVRLCKKYAEHNNDDTLTIDELAAIKLYTMEWQPYTDSFYYILNTTLRNEDRQALKPWFLYLKLIFTALARLPKTKITVYRGLVLPNSEIYRQGNIIVWWGFSSCSIKRDISENVCFHTANGTNTLFIIRCMTGKYISKYSLFDQEKEVLLLPATTLQVVRSYPSKDGRYNVIHLQEIKSQYELLESIQVDKDISLLETSLVSRTVRRLLKRSKPEFKTKLDEEIAMFRNNSHACLRRKRFTDNELEIVVEEVIRKKQCKALFLRGNEITSQGAIILGRSLQDNITLNELYLTDVQIADIGAETIARALLNSSNSCLQQLSLNNNGITDIGGEILSNMLKKNKSLTHVWITKNVLGDRSIRSFAKEVLGNNTLELLSFKWNEFHESETVDAIMEMLERHRTLKRFEITGQSLSSFDLKRLKQLAKSNHTLVLDIH